MYRNACKIRVVAMLAAVWMLALSSVALAASPISEDGCYKGIRRAGNGKAVEDNGAITRKGVNRFPYQRVKAVEHFPDDIGEWQFVEYGEDFTIQYVDSFPDIKVQFVEHWPGVD